MLPHLHRERGSWLLRVRALLERSCKWRGCDFHTFLDAAEQGNLFIAPCSINKNIDIWLPDINSRIAWRITTIYRHIDLLSHP